MCVLVLWTTKSSNPGLPFHRSVIELNFTTPVSPKCSTGIRVVAFPVHCYTLVNQVLTTLKNNFRNLLSLGICVYHDSPLACVLVSP